MWFCNVLSSMGIPQIAAIMGSCVAGGAYLPIMCDETIIVEKSGSVFLAGSHLVKAAIGEVIDNETLGGASTHCEISGVTDHKCKDDQSCLTNIKDIFAVIGAVVEFVVVKLGIFPTQDAAKPISVLSLVHV